MPDSDGSLGPPPVRRSHREAVDALCLSGGRGQVEGILRRALSARAATRRRIKGVGGQESPYEHRSGGSTSRPIRRRPPRSGRLRISQRTSAEFASGRQTPPVSTLWRWTQKSCASSTRFVGRAESAASGRCDIRNLIGPLREPECRRISSSSVKPFDRQTCQDFLEAVLESVYAEPEDLIGPADQGKGPAPRSTERAMSPAWPFMQSAACGRSSPAIRSPTSSVERVGGGDDAKEGRDGGKISPDLIVHERTRPSANYLAIEVKRATTPRRRAWRRQPDAAHVRVAGPDADDIDKVAYYAHLKKLRPPQHSYHWSVYVELDRNGAECGGSVRILSTIRGPESTLPPASSSLTAGTALERSVFRAETDRNLPATTPSALRDWHNGLRWRRDTSPISRLCVLSPPVGARRRPNQESGGSYGVCGLLTVLLPRIDVSGGDFRSERHTHSSQSYREAS